MAYLGLLASENKTYFIFGKHSHAHPLGTGPAARGWTSLPRPPPASHRVNRVCAEPRDPVYSPGAPDTCVSGFSTVKAGGFGERMRSEDTLSAKGKREKDTGKRLWRPRAAAPSTPASGPAITQDAPPPAPRLRAAAHRTAAAHRYRRRQRHGKFRPAPWRKSQDSPFPSTSTQSAGSSGDARDASLGDT